MYNCSFPINNSLSPVPKPNSRTHPILQAATFCGVDYIYLRWYIRCLSCYTTSPHWPLLLDDSWCTERETVPTGSWFRHSVTGSDFLAPIDHDGSPSSTQTHADVAAFFPPELQQRSKADRSARLARQGASTAAATGTGSQTLAVCAFLKKETTRRGEWLDQYTSHPHRSTGDTRTQQPTFHH